MKKLFLNKKSKVKEKVMFSLMTASVVAVIALFIGLGHPKIYNMLIGVVLLAAILGFFSGYFFISAGEESDDDT